MRTRTVLTAALVWWLTSVGAFGAVDAETAPPPETQERPSFPARVLQDAQALAVSTSRWDAAKLRRFGVAAAAIGGTMLLDEEIRELAQRNRSSRGDRIAERLRPLGNRAGALALIGVFWVTGELSGERNLSMIGEDAFEATLFSAGLITPALKSAAGRARPVEEAGAFHFEPFSGLQSFPSGEATQAFTIAAVVAAHSDKRWVDVAAWSLAGLIGWQRVNFDRHWASDVVAGALIGSGVGRWVVRRRLANEPGEALVTLTPMVAGAGWGLRVTASW